MNSVTPTPPQNQTAQHRVEFFRLPQPGKRDPYFGLSRAWYYKAATLGEIRMVAVRQRNALRGVRLVVYDSVADYIRRSAQFVANENQPALALNQLPVSLPHS
ncbi:MAG: hypothetical protein ABIY47_05950 [Opitutaceae bacterium]